MRRLGIGYGKETSLPHVRCRDGKPLDRRGAERARRCFSGKVDGRTTKKLSEQTP
jgi:hypothetical protein